MSDTKYKVVGKEFHGIEIASMLIENEEGKRKKISMSDVVKLARGGKLSNAQSLFNYIHGNYIISFDDSLLNMETMERSGGVHLVLTARIMQDDKCIGYKALDDKNKTYKLSIEKVWELAERGSINDISAKINGDKKVLLSTGDIKLKDLPIVNSV